MNAKSWQSAIFTPQVICFGMLASTFVYAGLIVAGILQRTEEPDPGLRWVFAGVGLAAAIASFVVPGILRRAQPPLKAETREEVDPEGQAMFRDAAPTRTIALDPEAARRTYVSRRQAPFIIALALSEVPAIMGLLSWLITDVPLAACLVLVAFSSTLMILRFPFPKRWRSDAEARFGALIPD